MRRRRREGTTSSEKVLVLGMMGLAGMAYLVITTVNIKQTNTGQFCVLCGFVISSFLKVIFIF